MSVNPQIMAQLLMQGGQQPPNQGGGMGAPSSGGAPNLLQQVLAMQQLKQRMGQQGPQPPQPGQPPGMMAPQAMAGNAMGPGTNS